MSSNIANAALATLNVSSAASFVIPCDVVRSGWQFIAALRNADLISFHIDFSLTSTPAISDRTDQSDFHALRLVPFALWLCASLKPIRTLKVEAHSCELP